MSRRLTVLLACTLLAAATAGCAARPQVPAQSAQPTAPATTHANPSLQPVAGLSDMPAGQKSSELSPGFVTEWPVVSGTVTSSETVSANEFRFAVAVDAPAASVVEWYRSVAQGRAFVLTDESRSDAGTVTLKFFRAGMGYVVEIAPVNTTTARVQATLTSTRGLPTGP